MGPTLVVLPWEVSHWAPELVVSPQDSVMQPRLRSRELGHLGSTMDGFLLTEGRFFLSEPFPCIPQLTPLSLPPKSLVGAVGNSFHYSTSLSSYR